MLDIGLKILYNIGVSKEQCELGEMFNMLGPKDVFFKILTHFLFLLFKISKLKYVV